MVTDYEYGLWKSNKKSCPSPMRDAKMAKQSGCHGTHSLPPCLLVVVMLSKCFARSKVLSPSNGQAFGLRQSLDSPLCQERPLQHSHFIP